MAQRSAKQRADGGSDAAGQNSGGQDPGAQDSGGQDDAARLDAVQDELYAGEPDDFVRLRGERSKQAKAGGRRQLATAIGALRRPTRSAWTVNLLAREAADELGALLDLGDALREAQQSLSGEDLRRLSTQRHRAVEALTRRASALARERGSSTNETVRREVGQALQVALADSDVGASVRAGHLSQVPDYGGFGPFAPDLDAIAAPPGTGTSGPAGRAPKTKAKRTPSGKAEGEAEEAQRLEREAQQEAERQVRRQQARDRVEQAATARRQAEQQLPPAERELAAAEESVAELRRQLAAAERRAESAATELQGARSALEDLRAVEHAAREALSEY